MEYKKIGPLYLIRLDDGDDLNKSLRDFAKAAKTKSGVVVSAIGMLKTATLGYYMGPGAYVKKKIDEPVEIVSLTGNCSLLENQEFFHLHAAVATKDQHTQGGHLIEATVHNTIELVYMPFESDVERTQDKNGALRLKIS